MGEGAGGAPRPLTGQHLRGRRLPSDTLGMTIERDGHTIIPRGTTRLLTGDRAVILVQSARLDELHTHLAALTPQTHAAPTSTPTTNVIAAATNNVGRKGQSCDSMRIAVVYMPRPKNAPWPIETWPLCPVSRLRPLAATPM